MPYKNVEKIDIEGNFCQERKPLKRWKKKVGGISLNIFAMKIKFQESF